MRKFAMAWIVPVLALSGCVHVNLPEHLVSDTIDAGKHLYRSLAHKREEPAQPQRVGRPDPAALD